METAWIRALGQARRQADRRRQAGRRRAWPRPRSPGFDARRRRRLPRAWSCAHPLAALGRRLRLPVPLLAGDHVTDDAGTGFVHTAPGHGARRLSTVWLAARPPRDPRHRRRRTAPTITDVPLFGGLKVLETEGKKAGKFGPANQRGDRQADRGRQPAGARPAGASYPHSWRSKAPVIFRNTPQWFIRMDEPLDDAAHGDDPARDARWTPSTPPPSIRRPARTASAPWSRAGPTG